MSIEAAPKDTWFKDQGLPLIYTGIMCLLMGLVAGADFANAKNERRLNTAKSEQASDSQRQSPASCSYHQNNSTHL